MNPTVWSGSKPNTAALEEPSGAKPPKLLDQVRNKLRLKGCSSNTEETFIQWIRRFILFHGKRHPREMGAAGIEAFLAHLVAEGGPATSTPSQALEALLFLYREVLEMDPGDFTRFAPATTTARENSLVLSRTSPLPLASPPKVLDQVRNKLRLGHYSLSTERTYTSWIRRFILFHGKRHPREMGDAEIEEFLTHLAVEGNVAANTQPSGAR